MANDKQNDFYAMLHKKRDMPKIQIITDQRSIEKYGGDRMYIAPPIAYDELMREVPAGKVITIDMIRDHLVKDEDADFTDPNSAGVFMNVVAWASEQVKEDGVPYWRTLKSDGELNDKYPGGIKAQQEKLEAEGHTVIRRGIRHIRYYVENYESALWKIE